MFNLVSRLKHLMTRHRQGTGANICIFSTPRSGTTLLAEMLATQGNFKVVNEPFNIRVPVKAEALGLKSWSALMDPGNREVLRRYLQLFIDGGDNDVRFKRERPFSEFWRLRTDRVLFKILFAGEDCVSWLARELNGHVILLLRHPIPVALSRQEFPRLPSLVSSAYRRHFSDAQLALASAVLRDGSKLEKGVLDWALQNAVPLRDFGPDWTLLFYEQLVLDPAVVVSHLSRRLSLPRPEKMLARVFVASGSTGKSSAESKRVLLDSDAIRGQRASLIDRWTRQVTEAEERSAMSIVREFGITCYQQGSALPAPDCMLPGGELI